MTDLGLTGVVTLDARDDLVVDEFPPADRDEWLRLVRAVVLKGGDDQSDEAFAEEFARRLTTTTEDGIVLQPLYVADDVPDVEGAPGQPPFTRSIHTAPRPWEVRQRVWDSVPGSSAIDELESGATGLLLELAGDSDLDGVLGRLLDGVQLDLAPVSLATSTGDRGVDAARAMLRLWDRNATPKQARRGSLGVDPIAAWARSGGACVLDALWGPVADLVVEAGDAAPGARPLGADGTVWHDAGASDAQELAWTVAAAVETARALDALGVGGDRSMDSMEFRWAVTADQFGTIAKLRAARRIWYRVTEIAGVDTARAAMVQHADASRAMLTRYDVWVNALRSTIACFSAAVGGADAITIWPHDALVERGGSALGRRIARNTQTVLQMESHLASVLDPAGGSWYVEARTEALADAAWRELQRVEGAGGLRRAVESGDIHARVTEMRRRRERAVATRRRPLTGLSEFPNIDDPIPPAFGDEATSGSEFEPFGLHRWSEGFERQRARADAVAGSGAPRPAVFLATLGSPAASTPRATFAKNLFEAGGIRTIAGDPSEFDPQVTTIACLCSSDPVYREQGVAAAAELRRAGAERVLVAGRKLDLDGVDEEIGVGSDVLDVLARTLDTIGVPA